VVRHYEPANEAKKIVEKIENHEQLPADSSRIFIGPVCSIDCLNGLGDYEVEGVSDGREKD
jgi:hypothetical protein